MVTMIHPPGRVQNSGQGNKMPPLRILESANFGWALQVHDYYFLNTVRRTGRNLYSFASQEQGNHFFDTQIRARNLFSDSASTYITSRGFPEIRPFQEGIRSHSDPSKD